MTKYLYRKAIAAVTLAAALGLTSFSAQAQYRSTAEPERKTPRAIGVLETYKNGVRRLLPVTFFYEKHFYDATLYRATPVPFVLYSETVYEVQQYGKPLGTYTLQSASQQALLWYGSGKFKLAPDPSVIAAQAAPVVVEDPSKPVLHRREGSEGEVKRTPSTTAPAAPSAQSNDDPERPKLHRREGGEGETAQAPASPAPPSGTATASASAPPASPKPDDDPDRPKLHRHDGEATAPLPPPSATATAAVVPAAAASGEEPDHPVLRRGQPVQLQGGRDLEDFTKEGPLTRQVAVSDSASTSDEPWVYICPEPERLELERQARALARAELERMASARGVLPLSAAKPTAVPAAMARRQAKSTLSSPALPPLTVSDEQFVPYDLEYNNYATVVYSARFSAPSSQATAVASTKPRTWVVTVVARQDEGKLTKLYSSVSDPRELDLYPEVRLIDAVDPDGYGHAALLFDEKKRDGSSWLIGRVTGYGMETLFETATR